MMPCSHPSKVKIPLLPSPLLLQKPILNSLFPETNCPGYFYVRKGDPPGKPRVDGTGFHAQGFRKLRWSQELFHSLPTLLLVSLPLPSTCFILFSPFTLGDGLNLFR